MNNEEIKKYKCIHLADRRTTDKLCPAIEELKKEKEKNKILKDMHNVLLEICHKLKIDNTLITSEDILDTIDRNYVSKDKIKELEEKLQKEKEKNEILRKMNKALMDNATEIPIRYWILDGQLKNLLEGDK